MPTPRKTPRIGRPWWRTPAAQSPALEVMEGLLPQKKPSPLMRTVYGRGRARGSVRAFVMNFRTRFEKKNGRQPTGAEIDAAVENQFTRKTLEELDPTKDPMMRK